MHVACSSAIVGHMHSVEESALTNHFLAIQTPVSIPVEDRSQQSAIFTAGWLIRPHRVGGRCGKVCHGLSGSLKLQGGPGNKRIPDFLISFSINKEIGFWAGK
jgi:hypothetical protein